MKRIAKHNINPFNGQDGWFVEQNGTAIFVNDESLSAIDAARGIVPGLRALDVDELEAWLMRYHNDYHTWRAEAIALCSHFAAPEPAPVTEQPEEICSCGKPYTDAVHLGNPFTAIPTHPFNARTNESLLVYNLRRDRDTAISERDEAITNARAFEMQRDKAIAEAQGLRESLNRARIIMRRVQNVVRENGLDDFLKRESEAGQ